MIEFVGLPPNLENHISSCHGNHAFSRSPYLISCEENFISHSEGPTEQLGIILKALGAQDRLNLNPSPGLIVLLDFPSFFLSFHAFS